MADDTEATLPVEIADESARAVFLAWERLRLVYNAVLVMIVIVFSAAELPNREFLRFLARAAVGANLCLCLGPVVEGYAALLGADRRIARWVVFVPGLLLACLLTFVSVFFWQMRGIDRD